MVSIILFLTYHFYATLALKIIGFAYWQQDGRIQSSAEQDALMLAACSDAYSESNSVATHDELTEMEIENTSGICLLGACGGSNSCKGLLKPELVDGFSRNCWIPGHFTKSMLVNGDCWFATRSTLCVLRMSPTTVPSWWPSFIPTELPTVIPTTTPTNIPTTEIPTELPTVTPTTAPTPTTEIPTELPTVTPTPQLTPTAAPTNTTTDVSTFKQTFLPTAYPTQETDNCPETVERLEIVIDYLLDYVFCLKHEKEKEKCNGSNYKF